MPRSPKPMESVIKETLRLAVLLGRDNYAGIQRSLERNLELLRQEQGIFPGDTPGPKMIKWIVTKYINELPAEVVMSQFSPDIWSLRNDYQELKRKQRQRYSTAVGVGIKQDLEAQHFRDVRELIKVWLSLMKKPEPSYNPVDTRGNKYFGFGLSWNKANGIITAKLALENAGLLTILGNHLIPPVVETGFWESVERLKEVGKKYIIAGRKLGEEILSACRAETGLDVVLSWQRKPEVGLTEEFVGTISRNALELQNCTQYAYSELAIVYLKKGIMVTQVSEGSSLMRGKGLDPTFKTTYISTAGAWVMPQGNLRLVCDGGIDEENKFVVRDILFVLQLHSYVIAVGPLDRIRNCCEVHEKLMQKYADSQEAKAVLIAQSNLNEMAKIVSDQLMKAILYLKYPGTCSFCPDQET